MPLPQVSTAAIDHCLPFPRIDHPAHLARSSWAGWESFLSFTLCLSRYLISLMYSLLVQALSGSRWTRSSQYKDARHDPAAINLLSNDNRLSKIRR